jgi:hypothetical protein
MIAAATPRCAALHMFTQGSGRPFPARLATFPGHCQLKEEEN